MKKLLLKSVPLLSIALLVVVGAVYASFNYQPRSFEELYEEEIQLTNEIGELYNKQLIKELKARKDLAIFKGQAAFANNEQAEVDRLQKLIKEIDNIIDDLQSAPPAQLTRQKLEENVASSSDFQRGA